MKQQQQQQKLIKFKQNKKYIENFNMYLCASVCVWFLIGMALACLVFFTQENACNASPDRISMNLSFTCKEKATQ